MIVSLELGSPGSCSHAQICTCIDGYRYNRSSFNLVNITHRD